MDASPGQIVFLLLAGVISGAVNAVAGGGSLLVFPALLAVGLNPLAANVTNSIAQWPGYLGIVLGNRAELREQRRRILLTSSVALIGSAVGCALLLALPGSVFDAVVPALVLFASVLMALGPRLKRWISTPAGRDSWALLPTVFLAAIYGGYFGGALGVIMVSALALLAADTLIRLNALKGLLSLIISSVTVVIFAIGAPVDWVAVVLIAPTTLVGGYLGARLARRLPEAVLRWAVVLLGLTVGVYLLVS